MDTCRPRTLAANSSSPSSVARIPAFVTSTRTLYHRPASKRRKVVVGFSLASKRSIELSPTSPPPHPPRISVAWDALPSRGLRAGNVSPQKKSDPLIRFASSSSA